MGFTPFIRETHLFPILTSTESMLKDE